ncbi:MAG: flagella basal body P-ring formation protein FlgA [Candidatus Wallbacteria bacterium HGW-Wallbacteria-1]|uniref:Flagella basal body P-ring formation protein FlgA n=1 Tax=Candidatus Wallbacteria bacterium HGW-Wallbacteria-1 TaxID=2013854 RepID=A0A2N1PTX6_9BACT|nr:MAG: flagella basal body P-ring formation protein FlgA [Candidatus Wallbacteria bacterium HGW-Wallbacteria-1]
MRIGLKMGKNGANRYETSGWIPVLLVWALVLNGFHSPLLAWSFQGAAAMGSGILPENSPETQAVEARWTLVPRINGRVSGSMITISDAFEITDNDLSADKSRERGSEIGNIILTTAPSPGTERRIDPSLVYYRLRLSGIQASSVKWVNGARTITLLSGSRVVDDSRIRAAVSGYLKKTLGNMDYEADFTVPARNMVIPDCDYEIKVEALQDSAVDINRVRVLIVDLDGNTLSTLMLRVSLAIFKEVLIASRTIEAGEDLGSGNLEIRRTRVLVWKDEYINDFSAVEGMVAGKRIGAGTAVSRDMFRQPLLVRANSDVTVVSRFGGVTISLRAKAMDSGSVDENVRVLNSESRKMFTARVTGRDTVEVR